MGNAGASTACMDIQNDRYLARFSLGSLAHGKHLVQALPPVFTLQCLTGKADKNRTRLAGPEP